MGITQSSSSKKPAAKVHKKNSSAPVEAAPENGSLVMKHAVIMQGLGDSGKATIKAALNIPSTRVMSIDDRFVTTPSIYGGTHNQNRPYFGSDGMDKTLWRYGGRGSIYPRWTVMAGRTRAMIFVVDSTDRARLAPSPDFKELPREFVYGYGKKTKTEQAEILATLQSHMTAKSLLHSSLNELGRNNDYYSRHKIPLLILATKQDVEGAMSVDEICEALDMKSITTRDWRITGINAVSGEGLQDAVDWLNYAVECPTDFTEMIRQENNGHESRIKWFKEELKRIDNEYKQRRLTRGDVLPAPPLFRTNGTLVNATPEQSAGFVLAPLSNNGEQDVSVEYSKKLEVLKRYQSSYPDSKDEFVKVLPKPSIGAQIKPDDDADQEPSRSNVADITPKKRKWVRATVMGAASSSAPAVDAPVNSLSSIAESEEERSRSVSSASASSDSDSSSSSDAEVEVSHHAETVTHTPEPEPELSPADSAVAIQEVIMAVQQLKEENLLIKEMPSEKVMNNKHKYYSIGSTSLPLPPRSEIVLAPHILRKKHWYSRKKSLLEVEDYGKEDIHKMPAHLWF